jgi:hypothetical protein
MMTGFLKSADNNTLKSLFQSQGMNLGESEIESMKNMMTPEMLKTMKKMDLSGMRLPQTN